MSTGQNLLSFESIDAHIRQFDLSDVTALTAIPQTAADRAQRLKTVYTAARPILIAVAAIPFIPATWRAVVTALVVTLDQVSASFKAGKDLAIDDGGAVE